MKRLRFSTLLPDFGAAHYSQPSTTDLASLVMVALGYVLAGRLGQMLAVPPNYATAIWPASGIALAGILLFGYRVWPGVFFGAVMVNAWTPLSSADSISAALTSLQLPISISVGAMLQAVAGAMLVRRFVGFPNALVQDRLVLAFLGLGGPVACLVAPSWGVTSLLLFGVIDPSQVVLNWWTWWVGDVMGVIIFAPLTLICFAQPRSAWRPRRLSVALPLCAAFTITVIGIVLTQLLSQYRAKPQFEGIVENASQLLDEQLSTHLDVIDALDRFYGSSNRISRSEFALFNRHSRRRHPGFRAVAWLPRVSESEQDEFELLAKKQGLTDFRWDKQHASSGPDGHDEHFPVLYLEPKQTSILSVGTEFASRPEWRVLMNDCRDSAKYLASRPIRLHESFAEETHVLVLGPVYEGDQTPMTVEHRRQSLRGFIVGVFQVSDIVHASLPKMDRDEFNLTIVDPMAGGVGLRVYSQSNDNSPHKASEVASGLQHRIRVSTTLEFAGRQWLCEFSPTAEFYRGQANRHSWLILATGLTLTALLGTFLLILSGRTARIEASESRYLDLYENAPDMFISVDVLTQRVTECNKTFLQSTGFRKFEVIDRHIYDLFDLDSRIEARRAFRSFLVNGQANDIEMRLLRSDGKLIDTSMNVSAVRDEHGESIHCRAVLRDITVKKRVDAQIKNQELELAHVARLNMMGEMATGLAHEINQPLAAIAAYAEGAAIRIRDGNADEKGLALVVDRIAADAHRAGEVIRRLRQFVRKREPGRSRMGMNDLVREVAQFVGNDIKEREVVLCLDLDDGLPQVLGDAIQIQQVLLNLVRNGCDAMSEVDVAQRNLMIRTHVDDKRNVTVQVEDRGHGLSESMSDQVFEAFYSTKDNGLGMGLAISRSIIESHGGHIWASSNLEGGASFHFSLPGIKKVSKHGQRSHCVSGG